MNHKWKKVKEKTKQIKRKRNRKYTSKIEILTVKNIYKCVKCGLMKGIYRKNSHWNTYNVLIYYKDNEYLSKFILPYKCIGDNKFLLTVDDFKIC